MSQILVNNLFSELRKLHCAVELESVPTTAAQRLYPFSACYILSEPQFGSGTDDVRSRVFRYRETVSGGHAPVTTVFRCEIELPLQAEFEAIPVVFCRPHRERSRWIESVGSDTRETDVAVFVSPTERNARHEFITATDDAPGEFHAEIRRDSVAVDSAEPSCRNALAVFLESLLTPINVPHPKERREPILAANDFVLESESR